MGDGRLLEQATGGDFVAVYARFVRDVYSHLYSRVRDRALRI